MRMHWPHLRYQVSFRVSLNYINDNCRPQLCVDCILKSIGPVHNVAIVCSLFYVIFAILGMQLFGGTFSRCLEKATEHNDVTRLWNATELNSILTLCK